MPDSTYNLLFQVIVVTAVIIYMLKDRLKREPEISSILRDLKSGRYEHARETAAVKIKEISGNDFTYQQKELFFMRFRKIAEYLERKAAAESDLKVLNALGWTYISMSDNEKALRYLREAEKLDCADPAVSFNIAVAMKNLNWHRKSLTYFRRTLVLDPGNPDAMLGKADMSLALEMYKSAKEAYNSVLEKDHDNIRAAFGYAMCSYNQSEFAEAAKYFKKTEKSGYNADAVNYYLGRIAYDSGKHDEALEYLEKAASVNSYYAEAYYLMALIYAGRKNRELATINLANAVRADDSFREQARNEKLFETYWLYSDFRKIFE